jgi:peptide/nickel transport system substrate-binding protein
MKYAFVVFGLVLTLLVSGCQIEGGVPPRSTPGAIAVTEAPTAVAQPTAASQTSVFRIGLLDPPEDLLPYYLNVDDQRSTSPVTQLLFPAPLLAFNYTYTTTGVLEEVPSLENGGITLAKTQAYLDAAGVITTTATSVVTDAQQLVVTYRWNPDLKWADGTPVTAADSVFAYETMKAAPPSQDIKDRLDLLVRYEADGDHTTRAYLKPDFTGPDYLETSWLPLPRHLLQGVKPEELADSDFARRPLGYGPYMLDGIEQNQIRLKRNPEYTGSQPVADSVVFSFYPGVDALRMAALNNEIDLAVTERFTEEQHTFLERDQREGRLSLIYTPGPIWEHLNFNLDVPLFQDIRVRRAIAHGTNRPGMIKNFMAGQGEVLQSWVLPGQWAAAPADQITRYDYDPEKARTLLDEVGLLDTTNDGMRERPNGEPLTITLITTDGPPLRTSIANQFKDDMAAIGLSVTIEKLPRQRLYSPDGPLFRREFELAQFAWIAGPDPRGLSLWSCRAVPSQTNNWSGDNFPGWCFREADQSLRTANTTLDINERRAAYVRQQQLFTQELPALPLFQRLLLTFQRPGLSGIKPDPLAPITWNIAEWQHKE